jgi:hypothetical protein
MASPTEPALPAPDHTGFHVGVTVIIGIVASVFLLIFSVFGLIAGIASERDRNNTQPTGRGDTVG